MTEPRTFREDLICFKKETLFDRTGQHLINTLKLL